MEKEVDNDIDISMLEDVPDESTEDISMLGDVPDDDVSMLGDVPDYAPGEDVSWWNEPVVNLTELLDIKKPEEMSDDDYNSLGAAVKTSATQFQGLGGGISIAGMSDTSINDGAKFMYGGFYGAIENLSSQTTPTNIALLVGTGGTGKLLKVGMEKGIPLAAKAFPWTKLGQAAISAYFAATMGKELPAEFAGLKDAISAAGNDPEAYAKIGVKLANLLVTGTFTTMAVKHVAGSLGERRIFLNNKKYDMYQAKAKAAVEAEKASTDYGKEFAKREYNAKTREFMDEFNAEVARKDVVKADAAYYKSIADDFAAENGKTLQDGIPVAPDMDYKWNDTTGTFDKIKVKLSKEANSVKDQIFGIAKTNGVENIKSIMDKATDGGVRRMSMGEWEMARKRALRMNKYMTPEERQSLMNTGELPPPVYDGITHVSKYQEAIIPWAMSGLTWLDKLGSFGQKIKNQVFEMHQFKNTYSQLMNSRVQGVLDKLGKDSARWKQFMSEWDAVDRKVMTVDAMKDKAIMEEINQLMLKPVGQHMIDHDIEIRNLVDNTTRKAIDVVNENPYHLPHEFSYEQVLKLGKKSSRAKMVEGLVEQGMSPGDAEKAVIRVLRHHTQGIKEGNLEYARTVNMPGWLGDPTSPTFSPKEVRNAMTQYVYGAVARIADLHFMQAKGGGKFNFNDEIGKIKAHSERKFNEAGISGADKFDYHSAEWITDTTRKFVDRARGINDPADMSPQWVQTMMNLQVVRKMGLGTILNSMQIPLGTLPLYSRLGFRRTVVDFSKSVHDMYKTGAFRKGGLKDMANDMGEAIEETMQVYHNTWSSQAAKGVLKSTGFNAVELFNRVFSERMGKRYVEHCMEYYHGRGVDKDLNDYYVKDKLARESLKKDLVSLGIDAKSVEKGIYAEKRFGDITKDELGIAAANFARRTQFRSTGLDVPLEWRNKYIKMVFQFKNFSFNQGRLINRHIINPFIANPTLQNAKPLLAWLGGSLATHTTASGIKNWMYAKMSNGTSREQDSTYSNYLYMVAAESPLFYGFDVFRSASYGRLSDFAVGPAIGNVVGVVESVAQGKPGKVAENIIPVPFNKLAR